MIADHLTEDEQHDVVRRALMCNFAVHEQLHDDLYQEGRLALLILDIPVNDYFGVNVYRWVVRSMWKGMAVICGGKPNSRFENIPKFVAIEDNSVYAAMSEMYFEGALINRLLKILSKEEKNLLIMYHMYDYTPEECAEYTGYSVKCIASRAHQIREKLRDFEATGHVPELKRKRRVLDTKTGIYYKTVSEAARMFNIRRATLMRYLNGKIKTNPTTLVYA